jgi:hypothetical protein
MTLCIAAICPEDKVFVLASDFMLSNEWTSAETGMLKVEVVGEGANWWQMFSGDPTVAGHLLEHTFRLPWKGNETLMDVEGIYQKGYAAELCRIAEGGVLAPYGITRDEFLEKGRAQFGDEHFARILFELDRIDLSTTFLVAGFEGTFARLFSIGGNTRGPLIVDQHDRLGFHAIGTGATHALASLYQTYSHAMSRNELIYRVCEAKFRAEKARSVGRNTVVHLFANDSYTDLPPEWVELIRKQWEQVGLPQVPPEINDILGSRPMQPRPRPSAEIT